jgi:uncharacterized membrane protein
MSRRSSWAAKPLGERRVELATWGALAVWVGAMMVANEGRGVAPLGVGVILLASALAQRALRFEVGLLLWAFGIYFLVRGIVDIAEIDDADVPTLAIVLMAVGAFLLYRAVRGGRRA